MAPGFHFGTMLLGDGGGDGGCDEASEVVVAGEGAGGEVFGRDGGGVGAIVQLFDLTPKCFGGEEAAVGGGDVGTGDGAAEEGGIGDAVGGVEWHRATSLKC